MSEKKRINKKLLVMGVLAVVVGIVVCVIVIFVPLLTRDSSFSEDGIRVEYTNDPAWYYQGRDLSRTIL